MYSSRPQSRVLHHTSATHHIPISFKFTRRLPSGFSSSSAIRHLFLCFPSRGSWLGFICMLFVLSISTFLSLLCLTFLLPFLYLLHALRFPSPSLHLHHAPYLRLLHNSLYSTSPCLHILQSARYTAHNLFSMPPASHHPFWLSCTTLPITRTPPGTRNLSGNSNELQKCSGNRKRRQMKMDKLSGSVCLLVQSRALGWGAAPTKKHYSWWLPTGED